LNFVTSLQNTCWSVGTTYGEGYLTNYSTAISDPEGAGLNC